MTGPQSPFAIIEPEIMGMYCALLHVSIEIQEVAYKNFSMPGINFKDLCSQNS